MLPQTHEIISHNQKNHKDDVREKTGYFHTRLDVINQFFALALRIIFRLFGIE